MRRNGFIQKILYVVILLLGLYIVYESGRIIIKSKAGRGMLENGQVARKLEDAAVRTLNSGYTAAIEARQQEGTGHIFTEQLIPVFAYSAMGQADEETEAGIEKTGNPDAIETEKNDESEETKVTEQSEESERTADQENVETVSEGGNGLAPIEISTEAVRKSFPEELCHKLNDYSYLIANYYTVDGGTYADEALLNAEKLLAEDLRIVKNPSVPQILIYHTHSQEAFADSEEGKTEDTIVGMGDILAKELEKRGYQVIHDTACYDMVDGILDRSAAYDYARTALEEILRENPTIEVVIDLHRDGVEGMKFVTEIDGKPTARIMFFNGISRDEQDQPIEYLVNPYVSQNLAFSLQLELRAREKYPDLTRNIYLKAERFNLHLRPRSLLIEAGTQLNTVEEEKNAMYPLAEILSEVLEI